MVCNGNNVFWHPSRRRTGSLGRMTPKPTQIAVRLEDELLQRIDAVIPKIRTLWHDPTRSDVVRAALLQGLPFIEKEAERLAAIQAGSVTAPPEGPTKPHKRRGSR